MASLQAIAFIAVSLQDKVFLASLTIYQISASLYIELNGVYKTTISLNFWF